jgi:hypothetical protein
MQIHEFCCVLHSLSSDGSRAFFLKAAHVASGCVLFHAFDGDKPMACSEIQLVCNVAKVTASFGVVFSFL